DGRVPDGVGGERVVVGVAVRVRREVVVRGVCPDGEAQSLLEPAGQPDVVEVRVGEHEAAQVARAQPETSYRLAELVPHRRQPGVHQRQAVLVREEGAVDVGTGDEVDPRRDLSDRHGYSRLSLSWTVPAIFSTRFGRSVVPYIRASGRVGGGIGAEVVGPSW